MGYIFLTAADTQVDEESKKNYFLLNHETLMIVSPWSRKSVSGITQWKPLS